MSRVEHASINVTDLDEVIRFLTQALPDFRERGRGFFRRASGRLGQWVHIGNDESYVALNDFDPELPAELGQGFNHLGFVVEDVDAVASRLGALGYDKQQRNDAHPARRRLYIDDHAGNEWEFVEYLSVDPAARNDYSS